MTTLHTENHDHDEAELELICTCADCSAVIDADDIQDAEENADGEKVCESCAEDYVTTHDGLRVSTDDAIYVETQGEYYRDRDWRLVEINGQHYDRTQDDVSHVEAGSYRGQWVMSEDSFCCDSCNNVHHNDDYAEDGQCQSCYEEEEDHNGIFDYNENVLNHFPLIPPTSAERFPYTLGVELEVEGIRSSAADIAERFPSAFIWKHDGSLNDGAELVTRPAPYSWQAELFKPESLLQAITRAGGESFDTDTCGLHVHVGRAQLTTLQIARALVFLHNPENEHFIKRIAQRNPQRWARIATGKTYSKKEVTRNGDEGRYTSLNLSNQHTVELRIFRGTLSPSGVLRAIQFTIALFHAQRMEAGIPLSHAHRLDSFLSYVMKHRADFPQLAEWLIDKEWATPEGEPRADKMPSGDFKPFIAGRQSEATRRAKAKAEQEKQRAELTRQLGNGELYCFDETARVSLARNMEFNSEQSPRVLYVDHTGETVQDTLRNIQRDPHDTMPHYLRSVGWTRTDSFFLLPIEQQPQSVQDMVANTLINALVRFSEAPAREILLQHRDDGYIGQRVIMSTAGIRRYILGQSNPTDLIGVIDGLENFDDMFHVTWSNGRTNVYAPHTLIGISDATPDNADLLTLNRIRTIHSNAAGA